MRKLREFLKILPRVGRSGLDESLVRRIRATWLRTFFLERYDRENKVANIVGFRTTFVDYDSLKYLFKEIFVGGAYHFISEADDPFIIDCGSNIGVSILYFKMLYPRSRIVGIEPGEEAYRCLEETVAQNDLQNSVTTYMGALANEAGVIDFYYDEEDPGSLRMSTKSERMPKQKRSVEALLLSDHIEGEVDFLKIDIEGAELDVLWELSNAKRLRHVKQIAIEYHHHIVKESDELSQILRILEDAGFGYQIQSDLTRPLAKEFFQDVFVYAYRK